MLFLLIIERPSFVTKGIFNKDSRAEFNDGREIVACYTRTGISKKTDGTDDVASRYGWLPYLIRPAFLEDLGTVPKQETMRCGQVFLETIPGP